MKKSDYVNPPVPEAREVEGCANPKFGRPYGGHPLVTPDGTEVWMWRKGQRVRFFDRAGEQVGPEQPNVGPALCYAASMGWRDPTHPRWLQDGLIREAREKGR